MNVRDSEFDRLLAEWLEDDAFVAPATPVEAAVDFARAHPRRPDWLDWFRRDAMPTRATMGLRPIAFVATIAVLLVLGVGGAALLAARPDPTPMPTAAAATPTASPSPTATPVAVRPLPPFGSAGQLEPGQYTFEVPDSNVTGTVTIGEGWESGGWYLMNPPRFTRSVSFWTVANVPTDACDWRGTQPEPPIGPTVDDLVAALDAQANTDMSDPEDVVVGGQAGKRVTMQIAADFTAACDDPELTMWVSPSGQRRSGPANFDSWSVPDTVWILDVDGERVVIVTWRDPLEALDEAEIADVMDSIRFTGN